MTHTQFLSAVPSLPGAWAETLKDRDAARGGFSRGEAGGEALGERGVRALLARASGTGFWHELLASYSRMHLASRQEALISTPMLLSETDLSRREAEKTNEAPS